MSDRRSGRVWTITSNGRGERMDFSQSHIREEAGGKIRKRSGGFEGMMRGRIGWERRTIWKEGGKERSMVKDSEEK